MKNQFDSNNSGKMGSQAEDSFKRCMLANDIKFRASTARQDKYDHFDFVVTARENDKKYNVEVKGRKRLNRWDNNPADDIIYVEFRNVLGYKGWIYGKADFIAFERPEGFLFVWRQDLANLAESLVQNEWANRPTLYKKYKRNNRPDECVTVISINDVLSLPHRLYTYEQSNA